MTAYDPPQGPGASEQVCRRSGVRPHGTELVCGFFRLPTCPSPSGQSLIPCALGPPDRSSSPERRGLHATRWRPRDSAERQCGRLCLGKGVTRSDWCPGQHGRGRPPAGKFTAPNRGPETGPRSQGPAQNRGTAWPAAPRARPRQTAQGPSPHPLPPTCSALRRGHSVTPHGLWCPGPPTVSPGAGVSDLCRPSGTRPLC